MSDVVCGGTATAIIAYVGEPGDVDTSPGATGYRGLALALADCSSSNCSTTWEIEPEDGLNYVSWSDYSSAACTSPIATSASVACTYKNGISQTSTLTSHDSHTHNAALAASTYTASRPAGTSDWFLPSLGQWNLMAKALVTAGGGTAKDLAQTRNSNMDATAVNVKITAAGGTGIAGVHWSSTERSAHAAWCLWPDGSVDGPNKNLIYSVRAALAF